MNICEGMTAAEKRAVIAAVVKEMKPVPHMFPTSMSESEHEAFKLAERQHAPGVTCRMNPRTFRVEYIDVNGGLVV